MGLNSRQHLRVSTALLTCTHYTPRHAVQTHDMHIYARVRASVVVHTSYSKHCLDPVTAKWCRMTSVAAFLHVTHYTSWWSLAIISAESEQTGQVIAAHITWSGHAPIDPGCDAKRAVVSAQEMNAAQKRCWAFASWVQQKLCVPCMLVSINNKRNCSDLWWGGFRLLGTNVCLQIRLSQHFLLSDIQTPDEWRKSLPSNSYENSPQQTTEGSRAWQKQSNKSDLNV